MTKRNQGVDLLRCISMFMIVFIHILNVGGILKSIEYGSLNYYIMNYLNIIGSIAVNLYALITGYVCVFSKNHFTRLASLWSKVYFYSVVITLIFLLLPNYRVGFGELVFSFFPVFANRYWYFTSYVCLFFAIPIINKGVQNLSVNKIRNIVFVGFILLSLFEYFGGIISINFFPFSVNKGYSPIWLIYLYLVGSYIRIKQEQKENFKKSRYLSYYFLFTFLASFVFFFGDMLIKRHNITIINNIDFNAYNSPFIFISSVLLFIIFVNMNITKGIKVINKLSSASFSVYLISTHPYVYLHIQKDFFVNYADCNIVILIGVVVFSAIIIYLVCSIIGILVDKIFAKLKWNELILKFGQIAFFK